MWSSLYIDTNFRANLGPVTCLAPCTAPLWAGGPG